MTGRVRNAPTLAVVAREAGVSISTVSKVLCGRPDVARATYDRVLELADQLGYPRRSSPADRAKVGSALVDVVIHELDTAWASALLTAVESEARQRGLGIVVTALARSSGARVTRNQPPRQWLNQVAARGTCGVLGILVDFSRTHLDYLRQNGVPCAVLDPYRDPAPGLSAVRVRNHEAERTVTEHLLALGHRRIGMVTGKPRALPSRQRLAGFEAAMAAAGRTVDPLLVRSGGFEVDGGRRAMGELLSAPTPPTAVVFASDRMALAGYGVAAARGLRIPDDLSVVGFDDIPESATAQPALTTVRQPLEAMARAGFDVIVGAAGPTVDIECDARLVIRASTAPFAGR